MVNTNIVVYVAWNKRDLTRLILMHTRRALRFECFALTENKNTRIARTNSNTFQSIPRDERRLMYDDAQFTSAAGNALTLYAPNTTRSTAINSAESENHVTLIRNLTPQMSSSADYEDIDVIQPK